MHMSSYAGEQERIRAAMSELRSLLDCKETVSRSHRKLSLCIPNTVPMTILVLLRDEKEGMKKEASKQEGKTTQHHTYNYAYK